MRRALAAITVVALIAAACGGDDATDTATTSTTPAVATTGPTGTGATTTTVVDDGGDGVVLTTPTEDVGPRPELAWEPVEGAALYQVVLFAPDGSAYWAWQGTETSVPVGGRPLLREEARGPRVANGMSWSVAAYDADGLPIALSEQRPISP